MIVYECPSCFLVFSQEDAKSYKVNNQWHPKATKKIPIQGETQTQEEAGEEEAEDIQQD